MKTKSTFKIFLSRLFPVLLFIFIGLIPKVNAQVVTHAISDFGTEPNYQEFVIEIGPNTFKTIEYFLILAPNGELKTAFNACDVCYPAHLGYSKNGLYMHCNNCGNEYLINSLGTAGSGGCWPGHLPHVVVGDNIEINTSDIEAGDYYFLSWEGIDDFDLSEIYSFSHFFNNLNLNTFSNENKEIRIVGISGQTVLKTNSNGSNFTYITSNLSKGIYIFNVIEKGKSFSKSFVVE